MAKQADILLGNLEDAIPVDKQGGRARGPVKVGKEVDFGDTQLWTRVNCLESPWVLDDLTAARHRDRRQARRDHGPEGRGRLGHPLRRPPARPARGEGRRSSSPILVHAILETALGVANVEEIATASPRMQGMSFGPADLAASRRMKTTRVGGGHPGYRVIEDPDPGRPRRAARRPPSRTPGTTRSRAWSTPAPSAGILPFYGPFGDIKDAVGCEAQFRAAFLLGCVGAWSLHPVQIEIAKKVFSPTADEVAFAKKVHRGDPRRPRRPHDRRQDAGRRHLEAVQGDGRPRRDARRRRTRSSPRPTGSESRGGVALPETGSGFALIGRARLL